KGRGDGEGVKTYINAFLVTLSSLAIIMGILGVFFAKPVLSLLGTPESMLTDAIIYLRINAMGIIFLVGYNFISTALRAIGDSKTPLRFVAIAVLLNIVLDPLFISVFDFGVQGAAIATILSQGFSFVYGMVYVIKRKLMPITWPTKPKWQEVKLI